MSALTRPLFGVVGSIRSVLRRGEAGAAAGPLAVAILLVWTSTAWLPSFFVFAGIPWSGEPRAEVGIQESLLLAGAGVDRDGPPAPVIVIVFQAADCSVAREDLLAWNGRDVRVQGVVVGAVPDGPSGLDLVIGDAGLTFPVSHGTEGSLHDMLRSVGYERTPILLAIDAVGRLREAGPLAHFADEQAAQDLLERLISTKEM